LATSCRRASSTRARRPAFVQISDPAEWRDPPDEQELRLEHVPHPGKRPLIQERDADLQAGARAQSPDRLLGVEPLGDRIGPERCELWVGSELAGAPQLDRRRAEARRHECVGLDDDPRLARRLLPALSGAVDVPRPPQAQVRPQDRIGRSVTEADEEMLPHRLDRAHRPAEQR